MRQTISGLVAAIAVVAAGAAPAMACGLFDTPCGQAYVAAPVYSGCNTGCGGWAYERLPDPVQQYGYAAPVHQYYYADQGPTYSGPGNFAPYPIYRESALPVSGARLYRGYHGMSTSWLCASRLRAHHSMRYGYHGTPHRYGYRAHTLRRYY